ncbi:MAG: hypothetical protein JEY94_03835 [Melioribacteraceae bacterium]|nr:hypothetical protein [Melioribacteraceae bacterium]
MFNSPELFGNPQNFVMDPVHGAISYFDHESKVIDHPLFQRLRSISQTDILTYVFPGASHSRFLHSLGTMHLSGRLFKKVIRSVQLELVGDLELNFKPEHFKAIQYIHICLRLASLLHDSGHAPFSHQFEYSEAVKRILKDKDIFSNLWKNSNFERFYNNAPKKIKHEYYSVAVANKILTDIEIDKFGIEVSDVLAIMETTSAIPSEKMIKHAVKLFEIVLDKSEIGKYDDSEIGRSIILVLRDMISGEVDVDKMDYLLRDSYFSGAMHGIYNLDHIINNLRVTWKKSAFRAKKPRFSLAVISKGLGALEEFVHSRYKLYLMMYNHKTCVGFTWLLEKAMDEVLAIPENLEHVKICMSNVDKFQNFTDTYFWEEFRKIAQENANSASAKLIYREKLKFLDSRQDIGEEEIENIKEDLEVKHGDVIYRVCNAKFSNIMPTFEKMMVLHKNRDTGKYYLDQISNHSDFFSKFSNTKLVYFYKAP